MSDAEHLVEQRSSVKLTLNAKGDPQVEVRVYEGADAEELERIRRLAVQQFSEALRAVGR